MTRGTEFLNEVTEKLRKKIREIGETIQTVRKDIEGMNEYYWENYTEMDQYGYENFDNQQALLAQVNANQENQRMKSRLLKMLDSPFFGSVDFIHVEAVGSFAVSGTCFVAEYRGFDNAVIGAQGNCREYNAPDKRDNYEENILGKFFQYFQQLFHEASERRLGLPFAFFEYLLFLVEIVVHQIHLWFLS